MYNITKHCANGYVKYKDGKPRGDTRPKLELEVESVRPSHTYPFQVLY